jgi:integrase
MPRALPDGLALYRTVFEREVGDLDGLVRAKRRRKRPMVLAREEAKSVLCHLQGRDHLFVSLFYGTGMRLREGLRLRVKDIDFSFDQITLRDGKGAKDRVTMLPGSVKVALREHLESVKALHEQDLREGGGKVYLPYALSAKSVNAPTE